MRDYAAFRAHTADVTGAFRVRHLVNNWRARRAVLRLNGIDPLILRDIGLTPEDVQWASHLPLTVNATLALDQRALQRARN